MIIILFMCTFQCASANLHDVSSSDTWHNGILQSLAELPQLPYSADLQKLQADPCDDWQHHHHGKEIWLPRLLRCNLYVHWVNHVYSG